MSEKDLEEEQGDSAGPHRRYSDTIELQVNLRSTRIRQEFIMNEKEGDGRQEDEGEEQ